MRIVKQRLALLRNRFGRQSSGRFFSGDPGLSSGRWLVWIFSYGSLMWNPALEYRESCTGTLPGWHSCFALRSPSGAVAQLSPVQLRR